MSEHQQPEAKSKSTSKLVSRILWIGGGVLWALVAALIVVKAMQARDPGQAAAGQAIASAEPSSGAVAAVDVKASVKNKNSVPSPDGLVEPVPVWDPQGIDDFSLTERSGKMVTQNDLLGKPWIVGFIFTRCAGPCPRVTGQMGLLQEKLEDEKIRLVTMTVDPEYDTPEILRRYAKVFGAEKGWYFLTGDKETMYRYIEENFKMPVAEREGAQPGFKVLHTTNLLLVDAQGVVQGAYNALDPLEMVALHKDAADLAEDKPESDE